MNRQQEQKDLYEILGVDRNATDSDIKKSYRTLMLKWHPDKNGNSEESIAKCQELTSAYEILSNPEKKQQYDEYGTVGDQEMPSNMDINEILRNMMGGGSDEQHNNTQLFNVSLTIDEIYNGCTKNVKISVNKKCDKCDGFGTKDKTSTSCKSCDGKGVKIGMRQLGAGMVQQFQQQCSKCHGTGKNQKNNSNNICETCHGEGTTKFILERSLEITPNFDHGTEIKIKGKGDYNTKTKKNKDILIKYNLKFDNENFKLVGNNYDLLLEKEITIMESLTGFELSYTHLNGKHYHANIRNVIKNDDVIIIMNQGLPNNDSSTKLLIKFNIEYPKNIIDDNEEYHQFITKKNDNVVHEDSTLVYPITLEEFKQQEEERQHFNHQHHFHQQFPGNVHMQGGECIIS